MGAWIEIGCSADAVITQMSLPLWERGLKFGIDGHVVCVKDVAPLVGAWIEISLNLDLSDVAIRRSPCGSVD